MRAYQVLFAMLLACGESGDDGASETPKTCDFGSTIEIDARPGALEADGSVTVYGSVRFAPQPDAGNGEVNAERTVYAVFVADQEVQPASTDFNFRSWSIMLAADRLAAFTTTAMDGTKRAKLPIRAYLHGGCVVDIAPGDEPEIVFPEPSP